MSYYNKEKALRLCSEESDKFMTYASQNFSNVQDYVDPISSILAAQTEIVHIQKLGQEEVLSIERKYSKLCKEVYDKRSIFISQIDDFWLKVFCNDGYINSILTSEDYALLKFVKQFIIEEGIGVCGANYKYVFTFNENPIVANPSLEKSYTYNDFGVSSVTTTKILWKRDLECEPMDRRVEDGHPVKRPHDASIFFNWFEQEDDDIYLQEELKNIWNDPLSYYKDSNNEEDQEQSYAEIQDLSNEALLEEDLPNSKETYSFEQEENADGFFNDNSVYTTEFTEGEEAANISGQCEDNSNLHASKTVSSAYVGVGTEGNVEDNCELVEKGVVPAAIYEEPILGEDGEEINYEGKYPYDEEAGVIVYEDKLFFSSYHSSNAGEEDEHLAGATALESQSSPCDNTRNIINEGEEKGVGEAMIGLESSFRPRDFIRNKEEDKGNEAASEDEYLDLEEDLVGGYHSLNDVEALEAQQFVDECAEEKLSGEVAPSVGEGRMELGLANTSLTLKEEFLDSQFEYV
jgi:hypothetical protein